MSVDHNVERRECRNRAVIREDSPRCRDRCQRICEMKEEKRETKAVVSERSSKHTCKTKPIIISHKQRGLLTQMPSNNRPRAESLRRAIRGLIPIPKRLRAQPVRGPFLDGGDEQITDGRVGYDACGPYFPVCWCAVFSKRMCVFGAEEGAWNGKGGNVVSGTVLRQWDGD